MSFNNLDYFYNHLPTRFQRADNNLFLKRFWQFFGTTLDGWDGKFDEFFEQINAETADAEFIEWWLDSLFGWSWFPAWFTLADKRRLYGNFAKHLARRGTARGIELWLEDFYISAKVLKSPVYYGEFAYGEESYFVAEPLLLLIEVAGVQPDNYRLEMSAIGEAVWGESLSSDFTPLFTQNEFENLLRYEQPHSQEIILCHRPPVKFVEEEPVSRPPVDGDAAAYLTAIGIADNNTVYFAGTPQQISGSQLRRTVVDFVASLKDAGLWDKLSAIYPFVGGTATRHKFNLKNPADMNSAFRLAFSGNWTHSATGAKPDGSTAYAETYFNPSIHVPVNDGALGYYSRTSNSTIAEDIGVALSSRFSIIVQSFGASYFAVNGDLTGLADNNSTGFYQAVRTGNITIFGQRNGQPTEFFSPYSAPNGTAFIGARRGSNGAESYTDRECALAYFGAGLTVADAANLYTIVQGFQIALGRAV